MPSFRSIPARSIVSASDLSEIFTASLPIGHVKRPFSSRFANTQGPVPSQYRIFSLSRFLLLAPQMTGLGNGEVCAKLLTEGRDMEPFVGKTMPPSDSGRGRISTIIRRSREKYATNREKVERRIAAWLGFLD